jgi:hypothetical protein
VVVNLVIEHLNDAEMRERRLFHEIERMADNPPSRWTKGTTKPIEMGRPFRSDVACRGDMSTAVTKVYPRLQIAGGAPGRI